MSLINVPDGTTTKVFALGAGELNALPGLLKEFLPGRKPMIIADGNTWEAAGKKVMELLNGYAPEPVEPFIFPAVPRLHPEYSYSLELAEKFNREIIPVAVGSGVINDIVKCAAGKAEIRYCCVPTACSVDGYTSFGGAMVVNGTKKTVPGPPPFMICADTDILASAPADMVASGYADLLTKIPAGVDWIIADTVGEEKICDPVWALIQDNIHRWVADPGNMREIFDGLAATGYAMQMYKDSRPASGAEHMFSHVWEMEGLKKDGESVFHGFQVGIGLIASTKLMEYAVRHSWQEISAVACPPLSMEERIAEIDTLLVKGCYGSAVRETAVAKHMTGEKIITRRKLLAEKWDELRDRMRQRMIPAEKLSAMLAAAGAPAVPEEIGLSHEQFIHGIKTAQLIRKRYTILDLLYEAGVLDDALKTL